MFSRWILHFVIVWNGFKVTWQQLLAVTKATHFLLDTTVRICPLRLWKFEVMTCSCRTTFENIVQINAVEKLARARLFAHYFVGNEISMRKDKIRRSVAYSAAAFWQRKNQRNVCVILSLIKEMNTADAWPDVILSKEIRFTLKRLIFKPILVYLRFRCLFLIWTIKLFSTKVYSVARSI